MTEAELAQIERWVGEATQGPWDANGTLITSEADDQMLISVERYPGWEFDAEFIARARTDVPALVAEVRRERALLERALHRLSTLHGCWVTDRPDLHPDVTWQVDEQALCDAITRAEP